ncbi:MULTISPECIES: glycosyltransferase family 4 protein [unclassified Spirosoma]|uniref:glycosyltransferase family 4 protein n=1 Tax=unclassified Spirosoma TaxID=2621999 RepID=UPI00095F61F6|nr:MULTISPECIES: glycosyltransferase family 4 protein [unclassified Spirosoma]MBN8826810.1 glycosyltransferase family 4 protein [Spirosoma sp.]OJW73618.1 MAG: glycosyltransferase WbuB [Spirosoma sp. 48-14]
MNILYLTFYFEPDLGPGATRNTSVVNELASQLTPSDSIDVLTTYPNRYNAYHPPAAGYEEWYHGGAAIMIQRVRVLAHKSSFIGQIIAFYTYYRRVWQATKDRQYDLVVASSSRLFTAFLGARISRHKNIALFLDIRDIFREAILGVLNRWRFSWPITRLADRMLRPIEQYTFGYARHINLVSRGFTDYFKPFTQATYSYHTHGIDELFIKLPLSKERPDCTIKTILYAGNIGEGQGLDIIIPQAAQQLGDGYRFVIIGDGNTRSKLEKAICLNTIQNIELYPPTNRINLIAAYQMADYLFVHLNDLQAFKRVIPSKLVEYGATDKPIVAGVSGYAATFIKKYIPNTIVFRPGDVAEFVRKLQETPYVTQPRPQFVRQFQRQIINAALARQIRQVLRKNKA